MIARLRRYVSREYVEDEFDDRPREKDNHNTNDGVDDHFSTFLVSFVRTTIRQDEETSP